MHRDLLWNIYLQEVRFFFMFPALNHFSFPKTVERWQLSMAIEDALQIQDDDLRPIEDNI